MTARSLTLVARQPPFGWALLVLDRPSPLMFRLTDVSSNDEAAD
jgi:hypothetical protein